MAKKIDDKQYKIKSMLPEMVIDLKKWNSEANSFQITDSTATSLAALRENLPGEITNDAIMPNMLMPAQKLESGMLIKKASTSATEAKDSDDQDGKITAVLNDVRVKEWLRVLCAVLFNDEEHLKYEDVNLHNVAEDRESSMMLRVLAKTLEESDVQNLVFRIFKLRSEKDEFIPIAFAYPGLKIGLCPVVGLEKEEKGKGFRDPQGWMSNDPISFLNEAKNDHFRAGMKDYFSFTDGNTSKHKYNIFKTEYKILLDEIKHKLKEANGPMAMFAPERLVFSKNPPPPPMNLFTDSILCVKCAQIGEGVLEVPNKDYKCVLPLRSLCINNDVDMNAVCSSAEIAVEDDDLIVGFTYNNIRHTHRYTKDKQIVCSGSMNPLGSVMLWPNAYCAEWNRYFTYLSNNCINGKLFSQKVYAGDEWHEQVAVRKLQHMENDDRVNDIVFDSVIETEKYPKAISMMLNGIEVGMLVPKSSELPAEKGSGCQLGIDFGTTNTIAYYRKTTAPDPKPVTIGDHRKILLQDSYGDSNSNQLLRFLFAPDAAIGGKVPSKTAVQVFLNDNGQQTKAFTGAIAPLEYRPDMNVRFREALNLHDELKWPENKADTIVQPYSVAFLEYMLLMWLWEIRHKEIAKVNYVFTYPGALSERYIKDLVENVMSRMPDAFKADIKNIRFVTEASVVIEYLQHKITETRYKEIGKEGIVNKQAGYLLLDIGGGSLDASLWQNGALCAEFSIGDFAGNKMQVEQLYSQKSGPRLDLLLDIIGFTKDTIAQAIAQQQRQNNDKKKNDKKNDVIGFYSSVSQQKITQDGEVQYIDKKDFQQQWSAVVEDALKDMSDNRYDQPKTKRYMYRKTIEMYFHFLFFLTGFMYGQAVKEGRLEIKDGDFCIILAGNGSRMYDLNGCQNNIFDALNKSIFLEGIRYAGCDLQKIKGVVAIEILPSVNHKHEVAFGASMYSGKVEKATPVNTDIGIVPLDEWTPAIQNDNLDFNGNNDEQIDIDQLRKRATEFFRAYVECLNLIAKANDRSDDYLKKHFDPENCIVDESFYKSVQGKLCEQKTFPTAAAEIFRNLLMGIGAKKFQDENA